MMLCRCGKTSRRSTSSPPRSAMWLRNLATRSSPARGSFGGIRAGFTLGSAINSRRSLSAGLIKRNSRHSREESGNKKQEKELCVVKIAEAERVKWLNESNWWEEKDWIQAS